MDDFAYSLMHPHPMLEQAGFVFGFTFRWSATALIVGALVGVLLRQVPKVFAGVMEGLAIMLLVASTVVASAYAWDLWTGLDATNPWAWLTYRSQFDGVFGMVYLLRMGSSLVPQLFWVRRHRRNCWAILFIAVGSLLGIWTERGLVILTERSQDFLPSSWHRTAPTF
jgi:hypothetical protein